jgi:hypothetical protein
MAISTAGYQVNPGLIPQYEPVNPSLQGFNPSNVTQGALEGIQVSSSLEQLRAFREKQQEWLKLSETRTKLAKDQAELEALGLDRAQRLHDADIARKLAEDKAGERVAAPKASADIAASTRLTARDTQSLPLDSLKISNETAQQGFLRDAIPFAGSALVQKAKTDSQMAPIESQVVLGQKTGELNRLANDQAVLDIASEAKKQAAPFSGLAMIDSAKNDVAKAQREREALERALEQDGMNESLKQQLLAANIQETASKTKLNESVASARSQNLEMEKIYIQTHETIRKSLNDAEDTLSRMSKLEVFDPTDSKAIKTRIPLPALFQAAFTQDENGNTVPRQDGIFFKSDVKLDPETKKLLDRYTAQQVRIERLKESLDGTESRLISHAREDAALTMPGRPAPASSVKTQSDQSAVEWARANPNDPRSATILRVNGVK